MKNLIANIDEFAYRLTNSDSIICSSIGFMIYIVAACMMLFLSIFVFLFTAFGLIWGIEKMIGLFA